MIKFGLILFHFLFPALLFSQEYFTLKKGESFQEGFERFVGDQYYNDSLDWIVGTRWDVLHDPVEIKFGINNSLKILAIVDRNDDSDDSSIIVFEKINEVKYSYQYFGDIEIGFPGSDRVESIFAFDYDRDGKRELFVVGSGEVRGRVNEDGLSGCCETIYGTFIFNETEDDVYEEVYPEEPIGNFHTAGEIKAGVERWRANDWMKNKDIYSEREVLEYLKRLDSIDLKYGLKFPRKLIDKIYKMNFGKNNAKRTIVSFSRDTDTSTKYYQGVFSKDSNNVVTYVETKGIEFYKEFKVKQESIFTYDVDKWNDNKEREVVILFSLSGGGYSDPQFITYVFDINEPSTALGTYEGWMFGIQEEKNATEIKAAIEYYHKHKYDEKDETPRD